MKISIALCTYNGERFLKAQLASISAQSRAPDELVLCDDASTDDTIAIAREFAAAAGFPVHLHANPANLGVVANFERAIGLCSGDIIALCDQDDLWKRNKLEVVAAEFERNPGVGLVFSDAEFIDAAGRLQGGRAWAASNFTARKQAAARSGRAFEVLLTHNVATGATLAFRSQWRELVLPFPHHGPLIHDAWLALLIASVAEVVPLAVPTMGYREHAGNLTKELGHSDRYCYYPAYADELQEAADRLRAWMQRQGGLALDSRIRRIEEKIVHLRVRSEMDRGRLFRLPSILRELTAGRYHAYSNGFRSAIGDFLQN